MHVDRPPFQADVHLLLGVGHAAIHGAADAAVGVFEGDDAGGVCAVPVNAPGGADALDLLGLKGEEDPCQGVDPEVEKAASAKIKVVKPLHLLCDRECE